ncbi:Uncharacterised protein [Mycobacterium tuberculosis]|nr:Uncharacterised protein [Mycobacterium tuberculosis]
MVTQLSLQRLQLRVNTVLTSRDVLLCERTRGTSVVECLAHAACGVAAFLGGFEA